MARASARTARAQMSLAQAQNEVRRSEQLVQQGLIAPIKVETDRLATLGAQREVDGAAAERRVAAHAVEQAQAALGNVPLSGGGGGGGGALVRARARAGQTKAASPCARRRPVAYCGCCKPVKGWWHSARR